LLAKDYLNCKIEKVLVAKDEWRNLGLEIGGKGEQGEEGG
jgi:hypothetical protein